jgi:hypothetical protein
MAAAPIRGRKTMSGEHEQRDLADEPSRHRAAQPNPELPSGAADLHRSAEPAAGREPLLAEAEPDARTPPAPPVNQPEPGSRADLKRRLERLPLGHPSSPYHVDGERKPSPPRLRHLELGLAGSRGTLAALPDAEATPAHAWPPQPEQAADTSPSPEQSSSPQMAADGSWSRGAARLGQVEVRIAQDCYDRFRALEGRNLFGGYGQSGLTVAMRKIGQSLEHGQLAADADEQFLLEPDEFRARLAHLIRRHPEHSAEQLARRVPGALSYTFLFDDEHYSEGAWQAQQVLQAQGYRLEARRNTWDRAQDKRILTVWLDPAHGLPFQVQFHTPASLEAQELARTSAQLISDPRIPPGAAASLTADLASAWAALPTPPGNARIDDYRRAAAGTAPGADRQAQDPGDRALPAARSPVA